MGSENLLVTIEAAVAELQLHRPEKKNALDGALFDALADALNEARRDERVHAVLLYGAGGNFCSGMDLAADFNDGGPFERCAEALANFDKPLIAAVAGAAVGGGATIPLHCDIVYAGASLRMRFPFVNLAVVPEFASSYLLQANIGAQRAAEVMYTAEWIDAERARELGMVADVYADDELIGRARAKARQIARWPCNALVATKRCLKLPHREAIAAAQKLEAELMRQQLGSAENIEAITAFFERREPDFK